MANAAPQLQEAFDLIESGDLQSARQLLEGIRSENENNPDYWWIYAHAVETQEDGLAALDRVRQLAPNYPELGQLSRELGLEQAPEPPPFAPSTEDVEDFNTAQSQSEPDLQRQGSSSSPIAFFVVAAIAVIVVIGGLLYVGNLLTGGGGDDDDGTPQALVVTEVSPEPILPSVDAASVATEDDVSVTATDIVVQATETEAPTEEIIVPPTDTVEVLPTDTDVPLPTETEVSGDPFAELYSDLSEFGISEDGITTGTTELFGETYIITTCSALGPVATQNILSIVDTLASSADSIDETIAGFSFEVTDCETDTVRLALGLPRETVDSYWSGEIDQTQLQQSLQRVN